MEWNDSVMWAWVVRAWVLVPLVVWVPGPAPTRLIQQWLHLLASMVVIAMGLRQPVRRVCGASAGWLLLIALGVAWIHWQQPTEAFVWSAQVTLVLTAAWLIAERGQWAWIRQAVVLMAWCQLPIWGLQALGVQTWWPEPGPGMAGSWYGTVGGTAAAAVLVTVGAWCSTGWRRWCLAIAVTATGSWMALPVILRCVWTLRERWRLLGSLVVGMALVVGRQDWWAALQSRLEVWRQVPWSLWGLGFRAFPGGFGDETVIGQAMRWRDYHNTWVDWLTRFGMPGAVALLGIGLWLGWQGWRLPSHRGALALVGWIGCWQSVEQTPGVVGALLVCGWIALVTQKGVSDALSSI